ncbi:AAA domain-containing protein [Roseateles toxinivorans]|uniref:AAA domain-containing protein n=2 Tax=Roseateles toxinivorans TaxID=270368 RepID=A0A4R6QU01_9BURK|nr:AAA domain-containing protein [Roseateles toxinivorans]
MNLAAGHLFKRYGSENKDVSRQTETQFKAVMHRLRSSGLGARLMHFLVLPDQKVENHSAISFPRERIADAGDCLDLPGFIQRTLGAGRSDPLAERVCAFFENRLSLEPDVSALSGRLQHQVSRISGGLASWVPRIEAPSGAIRVCATAGSGKTQLALRLLRDARSADLRAAYVCFNRPLAEHVRDIAPPGVQVHSFHQLCWERDGRPVGVPNFAAMTQRYLTACLAAAPDLDLLVVDELQDMQADWVQALIARLKPSSQLYLLDDPSQCLYTDREEIEVADAVVVRSDENFRTPQQLVQTINALRLTPDAVLACSPFAGDVPGLHAYKVDGGSLVKATIKAVQCCLDKGFGFDDVAVLCWRGRDSSRLMNESQLGEWRVQHFDGSYDEQGQPNRTEGDLRLETLRRFKGQSAKAVVLTEVDFEQLGPLQCRMLFVGLTRARMHLELVLSEAAERALIARMTEGGAPGEPPAS